MIYINGKVAKLGDKVLIGRQYQGVVVANIDGDEYSIEHPKDRWGYLKSGVIIDTDFGGLVHYNQESLVGEYFDLVSRKSN